jgi:hypothetical protein
MEPCVEQSMANDPMLLEIRDRLIDRIDRRLAVILTGSLAIHIGIAGFAWAHDVELPPERAYVAVPLFQQDVIDVTLPDPVVAPSPQPGHGGIAKPTTTTKARSPRSIVQPAPVNGQSLAGLLTTSDEVRAAPKLALPSVDAQPHPMIGDGTHTSRVDDDAHAAMLPGPTITNDQTLTHVDRHDHPLPGRVIPGTVKQEDSTTLTPAAVLERIQSTYLAGLQRCYRLGLAQDATLSGRVSISFTVDARGQVEDADANGLSSQVDSCISDQMTRWRFPVPRSKTGSPTDAAFSVSLALQPS